MRSEPTNAVDAQESTDLLVDAVCEIDRLEARNRLALQYRPYVYKIAHELAKVAHTTLEVEDLAGWGSVGLLEAAERFDASRGVRFRSFAHARIRGAMLDAIRAYHGRHAREIEARGVHELRRVRRFSTDASFALFDLDVHTDDHSSESHEPIVPTATAPDLLLLANESRQLVEKALRILSPLERTVILQHYVHGEAVCVIARRHGLSKSWLSRVHARAIAKLRRAVRRLEKGLVGASPRDREAQRARRTNSPVVVSTTTRSPASR